MSISTQDCDRCHRPMPDQLSPEFSRWKALDGAGVELICPVCMTLGEEPVSAFDGDGSGEAVGQSDGAALKDKVTAELCTRLATVVSDMLTALVSGVVADLEELGGISASRIEEIARGGEITNGELEELGYAFVQVLRALREQ